MSEFTKLPFPPTPRSPRRLMIWDGSPVPEGMVALRLIEVGDNEIMLAAVDDEGVCLLDPEDEEFAGSLLTIGNQYVDRSLNVMPSLGFASDVNGCVMSDPALDALSARRAKNYGGKRASFRAIDGDVP